MSGRIIFDTDTDPGVQVVRLEGGGASFSCKDDWCGDSETGFGALVTVRLDLDQVRDLHQALGEFLGERR